MAKSSNKRRRTLDPSSWWSARDAQTRRNVRDWFDYLDDNLLEELATLRARIKKDGTRAEQIRNQLIKLLEDVGAEAGRSPNWECFIYEYERAEYTVAASSMRFLRVRHRSKRSR